MSLIELTQSALDLEPAFKLVCESCGSLSIKLAEHKDANTGSLVHCGRCDIVRGTREQLNELARAGTNVFGL